MSMTGPFTPDLVARLSGSVVGRRAEIEQVVAALAARRHLLLEGPPGTGKSTLLRHLATEVGRGFRFVEGNAELTPARLVGTFDPAAVLDSGYAPEVFLDGPLLGALRDGALLYIEEINRIDTWVSHNKAAAAAELAGVLGLDKEITTLYVERVRFGTAPVTRDILAEQQEIADTFHALKLIPKKLHLLHAAPVDL